jgi:hypothetical protein
MLDAKRHMHLEARVEPQTPLASLASWCTGETGKLAINDAVDRPLVALHGPIGYAKTPKMSFSPLPSLQHRDSVTTFPTSRIRVGEIVLS